MSRRIMAELPEDLVRRMRNWARWAAGGGLPKLASCAMWGIAPSGSRGDQVINTLSGEAGDTDMALNAVPVRYAQAVRLFWQYEGSALAGLARRCSCDYRTYESRVIEGHTRLRSEMAQRSDAAQRYREAFAEVARCA